MKRTITLLSLSGLGFLLYFILNPEIKYVITEAYFNVSGTSSLHDWEIISDEATGEADFSINNNQISSINSLQINIPAKSLKSGKRAMDNNTYQALNSKEHPQITFKLDKVQNISQRNGSSIISATGLLTVAGTSRNISLNVTGTPHKEGFLFEGTHSLKMTDFNITPPTAVMGTIRTGDEININFRINYQTQNKNI
jgi:polyisoprenoid-binding protein YceI